ncbi:MAG: glycosyltransferase, exosortase A system-associated [Gammaproteobacteria bacterium]|nr:glycosyltransferase, exosortase A system-associated [Gammaproteobacteria bacterium]
MKVLHILDHSIPLHSGYTFRSRAILLGQQKLDITTCHVTSPKQGEVTSLKEQCEDLTFYRSEQPNSLLARLPIINQLSVVFKLAARIKQVAKIEQPEILHAHSPALNGLAALIAAKSLKIPVIYEIRAFWEDAAVDHGDCVEGDVRYRLSHWLETYVVKRVQAVTTICEGLRSDLISRGIAKDKITIIPNAVNIEFFPQLSEKCSSLQQKFQLNDAFVVGFAGSFYQYEGLDILIKALAITKKMGLNIKVLLVGGGFQLDNILALIEQLDLKKDVVLTGRVPHSEIKDYYSVMDVTALPRKSMRLTELVTPLKPLEAMALGVPVIGSDIGGHRELIEHNNTGLLFDPDNPQALADTLSSLVNGDIDIKSLITNGRTYVEEVRNWPVSIANYPKVYRSVL